MSKYNGWTNYATWRVNLEIFDGMTVEDVCGNSVVDVNKLKHSLKALAEDLIDQSSTEGLAKDYALAFLSDVNWYEIAEHMIAEHERESGQS